MLIWSALFLFSMSLATNENDDGVLDIAAFNVQVFGRKKLKDEAVREKLIDIILRYDLILIQEIRDKSGKAIGKLLKEINNKTKIPKVKYKLEISARLGRTSSKEQYGFIYREDWLNVTATSVYNDTRDVFEREPFFVRFSSEKAAVNDFVVVGIHTKPKDAENEISALADVYDNIVEKWGVSDVIMMGDFNAGCNFAKNWTNIKLALDRRFIWLIDDGVDTTVKETECPYDRIVVRGKNLLPAIVPESPQAYRYDYDTGMDKSLAKKISDHYPVEFQIKSQEEYGNMKYKNAFTFKDNSSSISKSDIYAMKNRAESLKYHLEVLYNKSGEAANVLAGRDAVGISNAQNELRRMFTDFPKLITSQQRNAARRRLRMLGRGVALGKGYDHFATLHDYLKKRKTNVSIQLLCKIKRTLACDLKVEVLF